jgi:VWFA-related protein
MSRETGILGVARAAAMLAALVWASSALAQAPAGPLRPEPGVAPEKAKPAAAQQTSQKPTVRVHVNLVTAPVTVRDDKGELVLDLAESDFHVYDNGVEQRIQHFDLGGEPLSIVLAVETSSRIEPLLPAIRQSGIVFTQTVMGPHGEAAVLGFDDGVSELQPFTDSRDAVQRVINHLPEGTSGVRLYDALERSVQLLQKQPENRKRVVLAVSEGVDEGSETKLGEVLREAQLANVTIYTVGLSTTAAELRAKPEPPSNPQIGPPGTFPVPTPNGAPPTPSLEQQASGGNVNLLALAVWLVQHATAAVRSQALEVSSTATGGMYVRTFRDRSIQKALDEIGGELHAQYSLSYQPPGSEPYGYHEIKVTVDRKNLKVRTRPGYYLAPPEK